MQDPVSVDASGVELSMLVDDSTEGSLSWFRVTAGKPENDGPGSQAKTPGPGPNPHSARPPPPQKKQLYKIGIIVAWPSESVVVMCVFVVTLPSIVPRSCVEAELAVTTTRGKPVASEVTVKLIAGKVVTDPGLAVVARTPRSDPVPCPI